MEPGIVAAIGKAAVAAVVVDIVAAVDTAAVVDAARNAEAAASATVVAASTVVIIAATVVVTKSENAAVSAAVNGLGFRFKLVGKVKVEAVARPQPTLPPTALLHHNSTLLPPQAVLH